MQKIKRAVAYARFSTNQQREESIDAQLRAIRKYCKDQGYQLVDVYADRGISGRTDDRPEFQRMIDDSNKKMFDYVVVHKLDRFSRDRYDSAVYKRKLKKNNVTLLSVLENIDGSPESIIMESLLEGMSEYYSANLSREVKKGMRENALKAQFNGGTPPMGYDVVDKEYVINHHEKVGIQMLFEMYDKGHTFADISRTLKKNGFTTRTGRKIRPFTLQHMLSNVFYKGDYRYTIDGEEIYLENSIPAIVDVELFDRVQEKMSDFSFRSSKKSEHTYLLSGIIYHKCGGEMTGSCGTGKSGKKYYYYRCKKCRKLKRLDDIEFYIIQMFKEIIFSDSNLDVIARSTYERLKYNPDHKAIEEIENKLSENKRALDKLVDALINTSSGSEVITERIQSLEEENIILEHKLINLQQESKITFEEIKEFIIKQKEKLDDDRLDLKNMIFAFTNKIVVDNSQINVSLQTIDLTDIDECSYNDLCGTPHCLTYKIYPNEVVILVA